MKVRALIDYLEEFGDDVDVDVLVVRDELAWTVPLESIGFDHGNVIIEVDLGG